MRLGSSFSSTVCTKGRAFSRSSGRLPPAAPVTNVQTGQSFLLYLVNPFSSEARKNTLPFVYLTDANATPLLRELRISLGWTEIIKKKPDGRKYCNRNQRFTTWQMREEDVRNKQEKPPGCTMQLLLGAWLGPKAGKVNEEVLIFSESDICSHISAAEVQEKKDRPVIRLPTGSCTRSFPVHWPPLSQSDTPASPPQTAHLLLPVQCKPANKVL
eukprot:XP_021122670.2 uncharacterized protein LOC110351363 isoform X1 [Anas platyrhynchos]